MKKTILLFMFLFCLLAVGVYAQSLSLDWWALGNAGVQANQNYYTGYALNYPTPLINVNSSSYTQCDIDASIFEPVVFDVTGDSFGEIITGSGSTINIYDRDCALLQTLTLPEALNKGSPGVANIGYTLGTSDNLVELIIGADKGVYVYDWSLSTNTFSILYNITNSSIATISKISCPLFSDTCLGFVSATTTTYLINLTSRSIKNVSAHNVLSEINTADTNGISFYRQLPTGSSALLYKIPYCISGSGAQIKCDIFNEAGINSGSHSIYDFGVSAFDSIKSLNVFYAQMGTAVRLFTHGHFGEETLNPDQFYDGNFISSSSSYNLLFNKTQNTSSAGSIGLSANLNSNWAVGDINKDGSNEACFLYASEYNSTGYNKTNLKCLNSAINPILELDVTGIMTMNNIIMADFKHENSYQCLGTFEGIFCYNATTNNLQKFIDSGYSGQSTGYPIVYMDGSQGSPLMVFTDSNYGFIIKSGLIGSTCGDGICESYENAFSCIADCNITAPIGTGTQPTGTFTKNASECISGYIEYNKCALRLPNQDCTADNQCLSGSCDNYLCSDMDIWEKVTASKTQLFGDSAGANNFVSLFFVLGGTIGIVFISGLSVLPLAWLVISTIAFTIFGWLSPFILVGVFLIGLIVVVLGVVIGSKS